MCLKKTLASILIIVLFLLFFMAVIRTNTIVKKVIKNNSDFDLKLLIHVKYTNSFGNSFTSIDSTIIHAGNNHFLTTYVDRNFFYYKPPNEILCSIKNNSLSRIIFLRTNNVNATVRKQLQDDNNWFHTYKNYRFDKIKTCYFEISNDDIFFQQ